MINRDMKPVTIYTYSTGVDQYGQVQKGNYITGIIQMAYYLQNQVRINDPRYIQVDVVGLTKDIVTDDNVLVLDDSEAKYQVKFIIPTKKYNVIGLTKK